MAQINTRPAIDLAVNMPRHPAKVVEIDDEMITYEFDLSVDLYKAYTRQYVALAVDAFTDIPDPTAFVDKKLSELSEAAGQQMGIGPGVSLYLGINESQRFMLEYQEELQRKKISFQIRSLMPLYPNPSQNAVTPDSFTAGFFVNETTPFDNAEDFTVETSPFIDAPGNPAVVDTIDPVPAAADTTTAISTSTNSSNRATSLKMLTRASLDPAMMGEKFDTIRFFGISSSEAESVSSILYSSPTITSPKQRFVYRTPLTKLKVQLRFRRVFIDPLSTFTVRAHFLTAKGGESQERLDVVINHNNIMEERLTPTKPPTLFADRMPNGSIRVSSSQTDERGKRIAIFRRKSTASDLTTDFGTGWTKIYDSLATTFDNISFVDRVATDRFLIYRALSYGENGKPCEDFSFDVIPPSPDIPEPANDSMTAIARYQNDQTEPNVIIDVINVPTGVPAVRLRRYDVTYDSYEEAMLQSGRGFKYIDSESGGTNADTTDSEGAVFVDRFAAPGRSYRYIPVGVSGNPNIYGTEDLIKIPFQNKIAPVKIIASEAVIPDPIRAPSTIVFSLSADFTDFGFSEIRKTLSSAGSQDLYDEQFQKNRSAFSSLIDFLVERKNLSTGLVESFGIVDEGEFRDDPETRLKNGVQDPIEGIEYTYSIQALVGNADSMFPSVNQERVDQSTLTIFNQALSKFKGGTTRTIGTLPSTARQFDFSILDPGTPADPRLEGLTTVREERSIVVSTREAEIKVDNAVSFNRDHALIRWKYEGDRRSTDHFRISILSGNGSIVVDTVHCDPEVSSYSYRHFGNPENTEVRFSRSYRYEVTPISIGYELFPSDTTRNQDPVLLTTDGAARAAAVQAGPAGPVFLYNTLPNTRLVGIN